MCDDNDTAVLRTSDNFKRCQGLAKAHFGIPKHFILFFERFDRLLNCRFLFFTKIDLCNRLPVRGLLGCGKRGPALLYGKDRANCHIYRRGKPFLSGCSVRLNFMDAGVHQNLVNIFVLKGKCVTIFLHNSKFSMFQLEVYTCSCRVTLDACNSGLIQFTAIRRQKFRFCVRG